VEGLYGRSGKGWRDCESRVRDRGPVGRLDNLVAGLLGGLGSGEGPMRRSGFWWGL